MSMIASPAMTPDDLLRMPDGGRGYELVDGQPREQNMGFHATLVAGEVYDALKAFVKPRRLGWVTMEGAGFVCFPDDPGRVRKADGGFIALNRLTADQATAPGYCPICPDLVVEVVSPNDLYSEVDAKVEEWLAAGARLVWVIDPDPRIVHAHTADSLTKYRDTDTLPGDPVLPGFAVPVADLFKLATDP